MKKPILIGLNAGIAGLAIGYKVPKDKNVGYGMIFSRITNPEKAGKFFTKIMMQLLKVAEQKHHQLILKQM